MPFHKVRTMWDSNYAPCSRGCLLYSRQPSLNLHCISDKGRPHCGFINAVMDGVNARSLLSTKEAINFPHCN